VMLDIADRLALHELLHLYALRSKGLGVGSGGRVGRVVYEDVAVRTEAGWRLAERRVRLRRAPG